MPRYEKDDVTVETSDPTEGVRLRAAGFVESKARTRAVREADAEQEQELREAAAVVEPKPQPKNK